MFDIDHLETLPLTGKISLAACLGYRVLRPTCSCCGGSMGIRRAWRKLDMRNKLNDGVRYKSRGTKPKLKKNKRETIRGNNKDW